ncbi:restriction endonuclease [Paenibacillus sp. IHB B 3415]|nr:restriction endonuclease [Paenibacillus sp. IHB B 3415]
MEEIPEEGNTTGLPEGAVTRIEVNKYERNLINRQTCLLIHGTNCKICGFDFEARFGEIGKGYIHVHHLTPVSSIGPDYIISPADDLLPVCPNCHAMLHKRNPPFTIQEIREIINKTGKILS